MSYILDALKRADAERERGRVPGLHSQPGGPAPSAPAPIRQPAAWRMPLLLLMALLLGAGAAYRWLATPAPADGVAQPSVPTPTALPAPPPAPPAATEAAAAPATAGPVPAPLTTASSPAIASTASAPLLRPAEPLVPPAQASMAAPAPTPAAPPAAAEPAQAATATAAVKRWAELPAEQRAQLPPLNVSGASHSSNPAHRLLIVNGAVLQEGQEVAPGLTLERIGPHEAVLNHRGLRFSIAY